MSSGSPARTLDPGLILAVVLRTTQVANFSLIVPFAFVLMDIDMIV
jgi:hypothetical protein